MMLSFITGIATRTFVCIVANLEKAARWVRQWSAIALAQAKLPLRRHDGNSYRYHALTPLPFALRLDWR